MIKQRHESFASTLRLAALLNVKSDSRIQGCQSCTIIAIRSDFNCCSTLINWKIILNWKEAELVYGKVRLYDTKQKGDRERARWSVVYPRSWNITMPVLGCTFRLVISQRHFDTSRSALGKNCSLKHINFYGRSLVPFLLRMGRMWEFGWTNASSIVFP